MNGLKIVLAGGTGFIGQYLASYFGKNNEVVMLERAPGSSPKSTLAYPATNTPPHIRHCQWDGKTAEAGWINELDGADLLINLAGKSVNCRYTQANKKKILESRLQTTQVLATAIRACRKPPAVWMNASSATIYQNSQVPNTESQGRISVLKKDNMPFSFFDRIRFGIKQLSWALSPGEWDPKLDFSVQVVQAWEAAFFAADTPKTRKLALRTAITLGRGSILHIYLQLVKYGLGGRQGNGRQLFSWVHIEDLARSIDWLWEQSALDGPVNISAPYPVTNRELMAELRKQTGRKWGLPAFPWMLELGAGLIGTETELILKSRYVLPEKLESAGFRFQYPELNTALTNLLKHETPKQ